MRYVDALDTLKVGDWFDVPDLDNTRKVRNRYYKPARRRGMDISVRKLPDGTVRVWRIK